MTIHTVLSVVVSQGWALHQLDVSNAFLNGELQENVFMLQPQGFIDTTLPNYVCKLQKPLYGLKQAPRAWYQKLSAYLHSLGFKDSTVDPSLFIYNSVDYQCFLLVYIDDVIITGSNPKLIN